MEQEQINIEDIFWNCSSGGRAGRLLYIGKLVGDSFVCGSIFWTCKCEA